MILFLDFDGVLHPSSVYAQRGRPTLQGNGELFMWSQILADLITGQPTVRLVLSTNWCRMRGYKRTLAALPEGLRERVIGSTFHSSMTEWYDNATRHKQIRGYLARSWISDDWRAIDDLHEGDELDDWPEADRHRLILTNPARGLSDPQTAAALRVALEAPRK